MRLCLGDIARCLRSESPSAATEDLKAKQQTLGASGNDRQNDDHAPGTQLEGRTKLEQARSRADWSKIMVLHDWTTTGLLHTVSCRQPHQTSISTRTLSDSSAKHPVSHSLSRLRASRAIMVQAAVRATPPSREGNLVS